MSSKHDKMKEKKTFPSCSRVLFVLLYSSVTFTWLYTLYTCAHTNLKKLMFLFQLLQWHLQTPDGHDSCANKYDMNSLFKVTLIKIIKKKNLYIIMYTASLLAALPYKSV